MHTELHVVLVTKRNTEDDALKGIKMCCWW